LKEASVAGEPNLMGYPAFLPPNLLDSSGDLAQDYMPLFFMFCLVEHLEPPPCQSCRESPSPVSSPATRRTPPGNSKLLLTCLSTLQHRLLY
ncbi:hypothetical protein GOODEAATRI_022242, partial [Goodea atripinnis]